MTKDLIFMTRVIDWHSDKFINKIKLICMEAWYIRDNYMGIISAIQCIDRNDWNIEYYLFMTYWEEFIQKIYELWEEVEYTTKTE